MTARRSWAGFAATPPGTRIFNHGYDQCVAVANRYHEGVRGLPFVPVGSAREWWTRFNDYSALTKNYSKSRTPVAGAVVVWSGPGWNAQHGHIGVVVGVGANGAFTTLEQNTASSRWTTRITRNVRDSGLLGFLVPKGPNPAKPAPPPTPAPSPAPIYEEEEDMWKPVYYARTGTPTKEWMVVHPEIGSDLKSGESRPNGNVTVARGYMVTTSPGIAAAWARMYLNNKHSKQPRDKYIGIQSEARRISVEIA